MKGRIMKRNTNAYRLALTIALTGLITSCAKHRDIEKLKDPNQELLTKADFVGDGQRSHWLSRVTVVKTSGNAGFMFTGFQSEVRAGHFEFAKDKLLYINDNTLYKATNQSAFTPELINSWDITHHDVKLKESNGNVTSIEEEDDRPWNERRNFKIDFSRANISEATTFPFTHDYAEKAECWQKKSAALVDGSLNVSKEYITFVVATDYEQTPLCLSDLRRANRMDFTYTVHYRYSFKRLQANGYKPYVYNSVNGSQDELMKRFGYFTTQVEQLNEKGLPKVLTLMNRFDPDKTHNYYFAKNFPEQYKWMFNDPERGIFPLTNKIFEKRGAPTRFYIRENTWGDGQVKELGDIRYSFVAIVEEVDPGAPLGYGPSDANPFTGEIVSANLYLWSGYLKEYLSRIQEQTKREGNKYESSTLFQQMKLALQVAGDPMAAVPPSEWAQTLDATKPGKLLQEALVERTFGNPAWARYSLRGNQDSASEHAGAASNSPSTGLLDQETRPVLAPFDFMMPTDAKNIRTLQSKHTLQPFESTARAIRLMEKYEFSPALKEGLKTIKNAWSIAQKNIEQAEKRPLLPRDTVVTPITDTLISLSGDSVQGKSPQDIMDTILYRTAIHELGHNLGLRHNFYGSFDHANFHKPHPAKKTDGSLITKKNPETGKDEPLMIQPQSSSVMDYLDIHDEYMLSHGWEPYDEAALLLAYAGVKPDRTYLFCTDEHAAQNPLCNRWDIGHTPSQVAMNLIQGYEDTFHFMNYRRDRAYWDTSGYAGRVFNTMWDLKRFIPLDIRGLSDTELKGTLNKLGLLKDAKDIEAETKDYTLPIRKDLNLAVKLSMLFYNAVIQQAASDRPYYSRYDDRTGELERIGIIDDKIFAMMFLVGDDGFMYSPEEPLNWTPMLLYRNVPEIAAVSDKIFENVLTKRVDMEPWFISAGRVMHGITALGPYMQSDTSLARQIQVERYDAEELKRVYGLTPKDVGKILVTELASLEWRDEPTGPNDTLGIVEIRGLYYVVSKNNAPIAFNIVEGLELAYKNGNSLFTPQEDLAELYNIYMAVHSDQR